MSAMNDELKAKIIEAARKAAEERGWPWIAPFDVSASLQKGEPVWDVRTNIRSRGQNVRVSLRQSDLAVVHTGFLPR